MCKIILEKTNNVKHDTLKKIMIYTVIIFLVFWFSKIKTKIPSDLKDQNFF